MHVSLRFSSCRFSAWKFAFCKLVTKFRVFYISAFSSTTTSFGNLSCYQIIITLLFRLTGKLINVISEVTIICIIFLILVCVAMSLQSPLLWSFKGECFCCSFHFDKALHPDFYANKNKIKHFIPNPAIVCYGDIAASRVYFEICSRVIFCSGYHTLFNSGHLMLQKFILYYDFLGILGEQKISFNIQKLTSSLQMLKLVYVWFFLGYLLMCFVCNR